MLWAMATTHNYFIITYISKEVLEFMGEKYISCYRALNATVVALSVVGSYFGKDPMADSATAIAFNALPHVEYLSS